VRPALTAVIASTVAASASVLGTARCLAEPIGVRFDPGTSAAVLRELDQAFPPLVVLEVQHQGGGAVEIGVAFDVADASGNPTCAFGLVEGGARLVGPWLDGPHCDPIFPTFGIGGIFGPVVCDPCDWSEGWPREETWRSDLRVFYLRYRASLSEEWTYGWVGARAIVYENLSCNPDCGGFGATVPVIELIALGFETEPGVPLPVGLGVCEADLTLDGVLDLADLQRFVASFVNGNALADRNADGLLDLADVQAFIDGFVAGCP
jgi:hypothetical protein